MKQVIQIKQVFLFAITKIAFAQLTSIVQVEVRRSYFIVFIVFMGNNMHEITTLTDLLEAIVSSKHKKNIRKKDILPLP